MNSVLYATCEINVAGRLYEPGDVIECGTGERESLLRTGRAVTGEIPENPESPNEGNSTPATGGKKKKS